jgi:hypothetical protein
VKPVSSLLLGCCVVTGLLIGCASVRVAQTKVVEVEGQRFDLSGTYDPNSYGLTLTINGEPVLRGTFPPYVPFLLMSGKYQGQAITASCYFGTILSSKGGATGAIAGSIQGAIGKSGDQCDITVGRAQESLYF